MKSYEYVYTHSLALIFLQELGECTWKLLLRSRGSDRRKKQELRQREGEDECPVQAGGAYDNTPLCQEEA